MPRHCIPSGYRFEYEGKRNWRRSSDERWEIKVGKAMCGRVAGLRRIDDASVMVVKVGGKFYAAKADSVRKRWK